MTLGIRDGRVRHPDLLGAGFDYAPFSGSAFDGVGELRVSFGGTELPVSFTNVSTDRVPGGTSVFVSDGVADFGDGDVVTFRGTLTLQGSYAQWAFTDFSGPGGATLVWSADLDPSMVAEASPAGTFVFRDPFALSPVIGVAYDGVGLYGAGVLEVRLPASGDGTITLALQDYPPCAANAAVAEMIARAAGLASSFGEEIGLPADAPCVTVAAPASLSPGVPTDQDLALAVAPADESRFADIVSSGELRMRVSGLPTGLSIDLDPATRTLTLSGTADVAGTYSIDIVLYQEGDADTGPYIVPLVIEVVESDAALADTGASPTALAVLADALAVAGAVLLGVGRRRVRGA